MPNVPVVMVVAAVAILAGVVVVALGRGGELAFFQPDYAPIKLDEISATDVVLFRPPVAIWGYNTQATDEALNRIADALTERDIEIAALRQQVADLETVSPAASRRASRNPFRPDLANRPGPAAGPPGGSLPPGAPDARPDGPRTADVPGPRQRDMPVPGGPGPRVGDTQPPDALDVLLLGSSGERPAPPQARPARDAERFGPGGAAAGQQPAGEPAGEEDG